MPCSDQAPMGRALLPTCAVGPLSEVGGGSWGGGGGGGGDAVDGEVARLQGRVDVPRLRAELDLLRGQCARCAAQQRDQVEQTRCDARLLCSSFNQARARFVARARSRAPSLAKEADACRSVEFRRWATLCSAELKWLTKLEEAGVEGR